MEHILIQQILERQFHSFFQQLTNCGTFHDYVSENPELDLYVINNFLLEESSNKILIIRSDEGNGGTHLLSAVANKLIEDNIGFVSVTSMWLVKIYRKYRNHCEKCENHITSYQYLLIDDLPYIFEYAPDAADWVKELIHLMVEKGGKVVISSRDSIDAEQLGNFINNNEISVAQTQWPSLQTAMAIGLAIGLPHVEPEIVEKYGAVAYSNSSCIREFSGWLISKTCEESQLKKDSEVDNNKI